MVRLKGYMVYDAEQLADKCGMEYGSFRRKVKKMTGYTAKEWVIKERVKDVEHYLTNTNLTLTEVAFTTGFDIEPERLLQGVSFRYPRRNTQKSAGNKKMHSYKNVM